MTLEAVRGENELLVAADPVELSLPPYVAHHGCCGTHLDLGDVDRDEVRELVVDAYRLAAPETLAGTVA